MDNLSETGFENLLVNLLFVTLKSMVWYLVVSVHAILVFYHSGFIRNIHKRKVTKFAYSVKGPVIDQK